MFQVGGNTANYVDNWKEITSDPWVISSIQGIRIPLLYVPFQGVEPWPIKFSESEMEKMQVAVDEFAAKNVIELCDEQPFQYISNIFLVPKPNGKVRYYIRLV